LVRYKNAGAGAKKKLKYFFSLLQFLGALHPTNS